VSVIHPKKLEEVARRILTGKAAELSRCVKACFLDEKGAPTLEGERVIADLRRFARLGSHKDHSFLRDLRGAIDPLSMARIEGRREAVNRLIDFLELDPSAVRAFVEVDNGRE
jgi:hypothetical protein